ncbi:hypothetical protein [Gryllotalpicola sp.]|uniref:hypothetical protein n=1 Tax=Gryllotalpicola sp. TaxID=1932787 RepID=UPI00260C39AB|nr:hypothetical protein [Gryllotalpicola sp.]
MTSFFQYFRGAAADGTVFLVCGLALAADMAGLLDRFDRVTGSFEPPLGAGVAGAVAFAIALSLLPEFSAAAGILVIMVGLVAIPLIWPGGDMSVETDNAIRRAALLWSSLVVALCLWELANFFLGHSSARADWNHPALSDLLRPLWTAPVLRGFGVAIWLLGGYALVRRGKERR